MITRERIYSKEATGLLSAVMMYGALYEDQLCRLYSGKEKVVKNLLKHLVRQKRVYYDPEKTLYFPYHSREAGIDQSLIAAFWVMLDFIDKIEYHSVSEFPVKISFFAGANHYEIVHVAVGNEFLVSHAMSMRGETAERCAVPGSQLYSRRIMLVDDVSQIERIKIPYTSGYCTVDSDGIVSYYKRE